MEEQKMGTMPVNKLLLTMAAPMILSMMIGALYNIVDSIFVSNYGEDALTAVSLAFPVQNVIVALGTGVGVGVNALLSRLLGEKKQEAVNKTAGNGLLLSFLVYFILLLFGIFGVNWFYRIQTDEQAICEMGVAYLSIVCIFSFGQIFQLVLEKLLQSTGRTAYTMITQITGAVINMILDPILIFGYFGFPAMGTAGAAIATVIGQIIAMSLGFLFNLKYNREIQFSFHTVKPDSYSIKTICAVGIPAGITMLISSIMSFGINKILLTFSTTATAVFGAYFKLYTFVSMAAFGLNNALISIVAYNLGTGKYDRIRRAVKLSGIYSALIGCVGLVLLQLFPGQIMEAFNASETMTAMGVTALRITSLSFIFACVSIMVCYALQGLSIGIPSMIISAARQVVILLPAAYFLGKVFQVTGVWMAFPLTECIVMVVSCVYLGRILKKYKG
jgi:putative MATE family efflux protein